MGCELCLFYLDNGTPGGNTEEVLQDLHLVGDRLKFLHTQDALLLLRHSLTILKLSYMLRTDPCFLSPELQAYDELLRKVTSSITISFQGSDPAWTQALLPVKHGGLGLRSLGLFAFYCWLLWSGPLDHSNASATGPSCNKG